MHPTDPTKVQGSSPAQQSGGSWPGPHVVRGESSSLPQAREIEEGRPDPARPLGPAWLQRGLGANKGQRTSPPRTPVSAEPLNFCEARTPNEQQCL